MPHSVKMPDATGLTLLNPHADDFIKTPVSFWLVRRRGLGKYAYLIDEPARAGARVDVLVDGTSSSLLRQDMFMRLPSWVRHLILAVELRFWIAINGLSDKIVVHRSPGTIANRSALYLFSYKNCVDDFAPRKHVIDAFTYKIVNLSHYFIRTAQKSKNISSLQNVILVAEGDLRDNAYFKHHFTTDLPLWVVPFAVHNRFTAAKPIQQRKSSCAATGSFHNLLQERPAHYYVDFIRFFKLDTYHPVRKLLFNHRHELASWVDCRISMYRERGGSFIAAIRAFFGIDMAQSEYFSFDIVEFYNDHKFAIVGEEISGMPAIGFFEAMACGCVTLGQRGGFYDGLGLQPGVDYLQHDGTIESIHAAIESATHTPGRIEAISAAGRSYTASHSTPEAVWRRLREKVASLAAPD
jgi:hypothetical protein